jgi:tetratricopeptide (TPR) repeat protein
MLAALFRALHARFASASAAFDRACRHEAAGDTGAAEAEYRRLLQAWPDHAGALHRLGSLLARTDRVAEALPLLERAAVLAPQSPAVYADFGNACWLAGRVTEAEGLYQRALALDATNAAIHMNLGLLYRDRGRPLEALAAFQRAYALEPARPDLLRNLVVLQLERQEVAAALQWCEAAAAAGRDDDELAITRAFALHKSHRPAEALPYYERALQSAGQDAEVLNNYAVVLQDLGRLDEAAVQYERAIACKPDHRLARWHRSVLRLLQGDFARGWDDYDLRLDSLEVPARMSGVPRWQGEDFTGRVVLVYGEQGLGDEIMFASCLPEVLARARQVIFEVSPRLESLMARAFPQAVICAAGSAALTAAVAAQRPAFEVPAGSLPGLFRRSLDAFPAHAGYLRADPAGVAAWRARLDTLGPGLKVGLSWRGGTHRTRQPLRSLALPDLAPILRARALQGVSLQYGDAAAEVRACAEGHALPVTHWPDAIDDLGQMAALISALDLVVSVCNTTIHLGGALGRPVWVMAPQVPEWRYGIAGEGMPWYPSVRIFRQARAGEWPPVIARVAAALTAAP